MGFLRRHLHSAGVVTFAIAAAATAVGLARTTPHPRGLEAPPDNDLPFTQATYTAADARRAFAAEGIRLTLRSRVPDLVTLGNRGDVLEVDAFGDPELVKRSGLFDYTLINGRYAHFPRTCGQGSPDAERWHGNVRVIVSCPAAGAAASEWLARVDRALAHL